MNIQTFSLTIPFPPSFFLDCFTWRLILTIFTLNFFNTLWQGIKFKNRYGNDIEAAQNFTHMFPDHFYLPHNSVVHYTIYLNKIDSWSRNQNFPWHMVFIESFLPTNLGWTIGRIFGKPAFSRKICITHFSSFMVPYPSCNKSEKTDELILVSAETKNCPAHLYPFCLQISRTRIFPEIQFSWNDRQT